MKPVKNLVGLVSGLLTVIGPYERRPNGIYWRVHCECGTIKFVKSQSLTSQKSKACSHSCPCKVKVPRIKDRVGEVYNGLTVIGPWEYRTKGSKQYVYWLTRCICGSTSYKEVGNLTSGTTKSCGCLRNKTPIEQKAYSAYTSMMARCHNSKHRDYPSYGGRGIYVCDEWVDKNVYIKWYTENYEASKSVDRKNNNGPYSPTNCRFASFTEQSDNQRERKGPKQ